MTRAIVDFGRLDKVEEGTVVEQATGAGLTTRAGTIHGRGRDTRAIWRATIDEERDENVVDIVCVCDVCE